MRYRFILFLILGIDALVLLSRIPHISISYSEATLLYDEHSFLSYLIQLSLQYVSHSDFGLRFVMIVMHLLSALLIYMISKEYLPKERNRLWLVLMFVLLPGVVSSALVVSHAGFIIFGLLLFVFLRKKITNIYLYILLFLYALVDVGFAYLFLGLSIYYLYNKKYISFVYTLSLYFLTSYLYGFDVHGYPSGHFLDTVAIYSAIFTPIIFIYIFYVLYRRYLTNKIDMLWYISSTALLFSLIISFRQRIEVEHFAPYLIIALPLAAQTFVSSYRVRLKEHRKGYKAIFILSLVFLVVNTLVVFFNKEIYLVIKNPKKHFAYNMHIAKDLAKNLKNRNIYCVSTDKYMQKRLKFYGINKCSNNILREVYNDTQNNPNVTISYKDKSIYSANVTKLNTQ
ncbi:hypothetical protein [Sulfurimonas sp.]